MNKLLLPLRVMFYITGIPMFLSIYHLAITIDIFYMAIWPGVAGGVIIFSFYALEDITTLRQTRSSKESTQ